MTSASLAPCPDCSALVPDIEGPTHAYIGGSAGCWAAWGELQARAFADPGLAAVMALAVDAYAAQHHGREGRRQAQSVWVHLASICLVLEHGWTAVDGIRAKQRLLERDPVFPWLEPPADPGRMTLLNVAATSGPGAAAAVRDGPSRSGTPGRATTTPSGLGQMSSPGNADRGAGPDRSLRPYTRGRPAFHGRREVSAMPHVDEIEQADTQLLGEAIRIARVRMLAGRGGPFGAVITRDGTIVARGWNAVTSGNDPTAHAEVVAIRRACRRLETFQLNGCVLYASCEPCPMCLAAAYWARLDRLVHAASRDDAARAGFDDSFIYDQVPLAADARSLPTTQLLRAEAVEVFDAWLAKPDRVPY